MGEGAELRQVAGGRRGDVGGFGKPPAVGQEAGGEQPGAFVRGDVIGHDEPGRETFGPALRERAAQLRITHRHQVGFIETPGQ